MSRFLLSVVLLVGLAACSASAPTGSAPTASTDAPTSTPTRPGDGDGAPDRIDFAVVGDSLTSGDLPLVDGQGPGAGSWVPAADVVPLALAGGWAVSGSTSADMRAAVSPVDADVVVVLAGTNDLTAGVPTEQTVENVAAIVGTVGVPTVLLVAVPPKDDQPEAALQLNQALAEEAAADGWQFLDPWQEVSSAGGWVAGASADGVHPVQEVADEVGRRIGSAVRAAVRAD